MNFRSKLSKFRISNTIFKGLFRDFQGFYARPSERFEYVTYTSYYMCHHETEINDDNFS